MIAETMEPLRMAHRAISGALVTDGKFSETLPTALNQAMGRLPLGGILTVEVGELGSGSAVITMRIWSFLQKKWILPGSDATNFAKTFSSANTPAFEYFKGPAEAPYCLTIDEDSVNLLGYDNGQDANV